MLFLLSGIKSKIKVLNSIIVIFGCLLLLCDANAVHNSHGNIETRPNEVYGMITGIETVTPNEGHARDSTTDIKTTPNEVYGLMISR